MQHPLGNNVYNCYVLGRSQNSISIKAILINTFIIDNEKFDVNNETLIVNATTENGIDSN